MKEDGEKHLGFMKKLLAYQVVETLVPWLHCLYPPITVCLQCSRFLVFIHFKFSILTLYIPDIGSVAVCTVKVCIIITRSYHTGLLQQNNFVNINGISYINDYK